MRAIQLETLEEKTLLSSLAFFLFDRSKRSLSNALRCRGGKTPYQHLLALAFSPIGPRRSSRYFTPEQGGYTVMRPRETCGLAVALLLLAGVRVAARPADSWIGEKVVTKSPDIHPRIGTQVVDGVKEFHIYRVERVQGEWLWGVSGKVQGWILARDAVRYDQAPEVFTEQIRSQPTAATYTQRGNLWFEKTQYELATADFTEAIRLDPKNASAYIRRGDARLARLNVSAKSLYEQSHHGLEFVADPNHPKLITFTKRARSEADQVLDDCQKALAIEPTNARAFLNSGKAWLLREEPDRALGSLDEAIRLDPRSSAAYLTRSNAWYAKSDEGKALADLDTAVHLDPTNIEALETRVHADDSTGQHDRLIADATRLLELAPRNDEVYLLRGNAWSAKKEYAKARADYEAALRVNPGNDVAHTNLNGLRETTSTKDP